MLVTQDDRGMVIAFSSCNIKDEFSIRFQTDSIVLVVIIPFLSGRRYVFFMLNNLRTFI
ncbi:hypothetical protein RhiirC2_759178 [Rhizophagus irregularis]|uniref:Uncharacterized protein n=1 Tax=Rhizophagus irregularis TaxID=588596 RepID=A0A2N1MMA9_9GLOM|nr:hypothetical protein RhiirC2_759178 [Rhizophagus irregularis]